MGKLSDKTNDWYYCYGCGTPLTPPEPKQQQLCQDCRDCRDCPDCDTCRAIEDLHIRNGITVLMDALATLDSLVHETDDEERENHTKDIPSDEPF